MGSLSAMVQFALLRGLGGGDGGRGPLVNAEAGVRGGAIWTERSKYRGDVFKRNGYSPQAVSQDAFTRHQRHAFY